MSSSDKTVLITGATRGIGLELATHYISSGWNVIGAARNLDTADKLKALAPYKLVEIDIADEASILKATKELEGETIDLLINNAGAGDVDTIESTTKEAMMRQFEVNAVGPFLVTRALLPNLRAAVAKNGSALVAQLSSRMGSIELNDGIAFGTGMYGYRTAKTALNMLTSCLVLDLKKDNINVVSLHPGYVRTDMSGGQGHINTDESVSGMTKIIARITAEDSGKFFSYDGSILPW